MANTKKVIEHHDRLNRLLSVGDYVAFPISNDLELGIVQKLNPKMLTVKPLKRSYSMNKYPRDTVKLNEEEMVIYLLKN